MHSPVKLLKIVLVLTFAACQVVCLSHCRGHDDIFGECHQRHPAGHGDNRGHEHNRIEHEWDNESSTEFHVHSCIDYTLSSDDISFWYLEIGTDNGAVPAITLEPIGIKSQTIARAISPTIRHGFTFIGRSPTAS